MRAVSNDRKYTDSFEVFPFPYSMLSIARFVLLAFATSACAVNDTYDYIIVGGGLTGLVVANRLSQNSQSM